MLVFARKFINNYCMRNFREISLERAKNWRLPVAALFLGASAVAGALRAYQSNQDQERATSPTPLVGHAFGAEKTYQPDGSLDITLHARQRDRLGFQHIHDKCVKIDGKYIYIR